MYYCHEGIGDCTSLQELMHGFSSSTISILDYQEDLQIGAASCVLECQLRDAENCVQDSYPENDEDNEHEDCSDAASCEYSETNDNKQSNDGIGIVVELSFSTGDKDLECVDWEKFYSTGDLVRKIDYNETARTEDIQKQTTTETLEWKKRCFLSYKPGI